MDPIIIKTLQDLGLNQNEISIYLTLLSVGSAPASTIGKRAGIERSYSVYLCKGLVEKGFIQSIHRNNSFIFTPLNPQELFHILEKEKKQIKHKEDQLHRIMGDLQNMLQPEISLPKIRFFEGVDGMIAIYKDMLKEQADIYDCNIIDRSTIHPEVIRYWSEEYMPAREKMSNRSFTLYNRQEGHDEYVAWDKKVRRITLFIPENIFPFKSQILIYAKKVAFLSMGATDLTGVILENELIRKTQFSLFHLAWNYARTLPENQEFKDVEI